MAEFYFNQAKSDRRALRNNSNVTGMSTNKNSEFKVPFPPRSITQTVCGNSRPPQPNQEGSALQCLKPIVEKLELFDKLDIVPQEELRKLTSELGQKLDSLCTNTLVQRLKQQSINPAPSINNNSDLHTIISHSQAPAYQPSVRSCACQGSTCASEIGYSIPREIPHSEPHLIPVPERPERGKIKPVTALASNKDENDDSVVSFFKKNTGPNQNTKNAKKKFAPSVVTTNTVEKKSTSVLANARTSRIDAVPRSQSAARARSNAARPTQPRAQSAFRISPEDTSDDELMNSALKNKVAVVINQVSEDKLAKSNARGKRKPDTTAEPKKPKRVRNTSKQDDDINITKNSLRNFPLEPPKKRGKKPTNENSKIKRVSKKQKETKENDPVQSVFGEANEEERNICGYDQTDQEMFGDFSTIINDTLQMRGSPGNVLKNVTKVSTNKNDQPSHIFSPFSNIRSTSGLSAISTPLSKTLPKTIINKRLKKPDVASEFKGAKSQPAVKRIVRNDVVSLDASQESEFGTSDFSDIEENSDES